MIGIYWSAKSPLTLTTKILHCNPATPVALGSAAEEKLKAPAGALGSADEVTVLLSGAVWICFDMYVSARVKAPERAVLVVLRREAGVVVLRRLSRFEVMAASIVAKGRYLFASAIEEGLAKSDISVSWAWIEAPFWCARVGDSLGRVGVGYRNWARPVWAAITATRFALLIARWAFMKTRMLAIAFVRGSVEERRDQACGFVSRMIVRREGGTPVVVRQIYEYLFIRRFDYGEDIPESFPSSRLVASTAFMSPFVGRDYRSMEVM